MLLYILNSRVSKTYLKKSNKRAALADLIKQKGIVFKTMSCSCYFKSNHIYCFAPESLYYKEYIYIGKLYNRNIMATSYRYSLTSFYYFLLILFLMKHLLSKQEHLEKEEINAKEKLFLL